MAADEPFLSRWSRRKTEARSAEPAPEGAPAAAQMPAGTPAITELPASPREPLPPTESLTVDSDFKPFMNPEVEDGVRQKALKALFRDPHFNVMDGLDTYIDDYSKPDPIPEGWMSQLRQVSRLGDFAGRQEAERAAREGDLTKVQAKEGPAQQMAAEQAREGPAPEGVPADAGSEPVAPVHGTSEEKSTPEVGDSGT